MKMCEEFSLSPRSALEVLGPPRGGASSRRQSRDEGREESVADGRTPLGRMTSTHSLKTAWKLKYQDFLPERGSGISDKGESFRSEELRMIRDRKLFLK